MNTVLRGLGERLARFLVRESRAPTEFHIVPTEVLLATLRPGDVLLVEGISRVSTVIKYLTQSTWSHATLYVGQALAEAGKNPNHCFVEADMVEGVRSTGISAFAHLHTRICRPVGLSPEDCQRLCAFAIAHIGNQYDLRNVIDLARYLLPAPPVPSHFRHKLLALGSGDPTRAICSTLIAEAFQFIHYPILPIITVQTHRGPDGTHPAQEILSVRPHSLFAPRDFDVSPYFNVIKPTIEVGFDYQSIVWHDANAV